MYGDAITLCQSKVAEGTIKYGKNHQKRCDIIKGASGEFYRNLVTNLKVSNSI